MRSSRVEDVLRGGLRPALAIFLVSPYLIWLARIGAWTAFDPTAWAPIAARAVLQASLSTAAAAVGGWVLFRALRAGPTATRGGGELRLLFPNVVPPLFVALALFGLTPSSVDFPFGLGAVVFAHALLNAGLIAVALERIERARLGQLAEAAWAMGVPESTFWCRGAWPLVRRDVATVLFLVFSLCLTSFSLPLLLQGSRAVSLEVAIYDLIRRDGRWDHALILAGLQAGGLLLLSWALPPSAEIPRRSEPRARPYRPARIYSALTWVPATVLVIGLGRGGWTARWIAEPVFVEAWVTTTLIGAGVAAVQLLLALVTAFVLPHARFERFLRGYLAPGPALTAFAVLLAFDSRQGLPHLMGALALISFAPLYRWQLHATFDGLRAQWAVARTLGAGPARILIEITWPQAAPAILNSCGLAAVWACGDFAVSGILLDHATTLPGLITERVSHYEWPGAHAALIPLALTAGGLFAFYRRMAAYVES